MSHNPLHYPQCRKCQGQMRPGQALAQTFSSGLPDFPGDAHGITISPGGPGKLIDCMKCGDCGWSRTLGAWPHLPPDTEEARRKNTALRKQLDEMPTAPPPTEGDARTVLVDALVATKGGGMRGYAMAFVDDYVDSVQRALPADALRAAFARAYKNDDAILAFSENNPAYYMDAIAARHHWAAFQEGAKAVFAQPAQKAVS